MDFSQYQKLSFKATAKIITPSDKDEYLAKASLDNLSEIIDISEEQIEQQPDLLYIAADGWVAGTANKNDQIVSNEDSIFLAKQIPQKYINLEHNSKKIFGALTSYGFRTYGDSRDIIEKESISEFEDPFTIAAGGYVWASIDEDLTNLLVESADESNENFGVASFSWEVLFKNWDIAAGKSKFLKDLTIISDPEEKEKMKSSLKHFGGKGIYQGERVRLLVKADETKENKDLIFLGFGLVAQPASDVKGIKTFLNEEDLEEKSIEELEASSENITNNKQKNRKKEKNNKKNLKIISHTKKINVTNYTNTMKYKNLDEYKTALSSVAGSEDQVDYKKLADLDANFDQVMAGHIADVIAEKSVEWVEAKEKAEAEKAQAEKVLEDLKASSEEKDSKIKALEEKFEAQESAAKFQVRMSEIQDEYELDTDAKQLVTAKLNLISSDEDFSVWKSEFSIIAKDMSKAAKAKKKEEDEKKEAEMKAQYKDKEMSEDEKIKAAELEKEKAAEKVLASATENVDKSKIPASTTSLGEQFKEFKFELEKTA